MFSDRKAVSSPEQRRKRETEGGHALVKIRFTFRNAPVKIQVNTHYEGGHALVKIRLTL
jgi:hypothetical protein